MTSLFIKKKLLIIWIDEKIENPENKRYLAELEFKENTQQINYYYNYTQLNLKMDEDIKLNCQYDIIKSTKVNLAIVELKKYKFRETIIIISGKLFFDFVSQFNNNLKDIFVIPKIIIFTSEIRNYPINENFPNHKFYSSYYITNKFSELKNFIELQQKELDKFPEDILQKGRNREYEVKFLFSHVLNVDKLFDTFLLSLQILSSKIEYDNNNFINNILKEHPKEFDYYSLLNYIKNIPDIPSELLAKYYIRLYTIEGSFYKKMKIDLLGEGFDKYHFYAPYIRTLYDALRKKSLISYTGGDLYSYQYIPPKELIQLEEEKKKNKKEGFPISVILSKSFISFSKEISEAKKFFGENKTMLILKKPKLKINNPCNADIREISSYPQEEEVLVFPVCILGIDDINKVGNNYTINLKYLEDYDAVEKRKFENNNNKINNNINNNNCKGNTFPNNCLPEINTKIKKRKLNDDNNSLVNEEEKMHRETDINNNLGINRKNVNILQKNKNNTYNKLIKGNKIEGTGLLKKAKLMKINDFHNKNNGNIETEINTLVNLNKEKKNLSKNSSKSKNKNNYFL